MSTVRERFAAILARRPAWLIDIEGRITAARNRTLRHRPRLTDAMSTIADMATIKAALNGYHAVVTVHLVCTECLGRGSTPTELYVSRWRDCVACQ